MPLLQGSSRADSKQTGRYAGLALGTEASNIRDVPKVCTICEAPFMVPRHRAHMAKYCSRPCFYQSLRGRGTVILKCDICDKQYKRAPSHANYITKTCSHKCRGIATRKAEPAQQDFSGLKRWLRRRGLFNECQRCGFSAEPRILVAHHTDRDRTNNVLANLECLCPNCHALEHVRESQEGWKHKSTKRRPDNREGSLNAASSGQ